MKDALTVIAPQDVHVRVPTGPGRVIGMDLGTTNSAVAEIVVSIEAPEAMAYPSAKGLTFDTVLMPLLERGKFPRRLHSELLERCLFVGASCATRWLYFSAIEGECMFLERPWNACPEAEIDDSAGASGHTDSPLPVIHAQRDDLADLF